MATHTHLTEALHYDKVDSKQCICRLCPRECRINEGRKGFCGTRENIDGVLYAINYGKSLELTQEVIETEAVFHRDPGAAILSIGNIGCNMSCDFCQNWLTAQMKYVKDKDYVIITPEDVIKEAIRRDVSILSWTYDDPVVWHEFVLETARLAKKFGLRNLYKSAFYINSKPIEELLEVMDIFSISLKSMDDDFYKKYCKTALPPVLEGIKQVYNAGAYLEISNLVVTGRNDNIEYVKRLVEWVLSELDENVPVHFVAFHPAYLYTDTIRTPDSILIEARDVAMKMGLKNVNIGNVCNPEISQMECPNCRAVTLKRHALYTEFHNIIEKNGHYICKQCKKELPLKKDVRSLQPPRDFCNPPVEEMEKQVYCWDAPDKVTFHLRGINNDGMTRYAYIQQRLDNGSTNPMQRVPFFPGETGRFLISRETISAQEAIIYYDKGIDVQLMDLLDRAYYPTIG